MSLTGQERMSQFKQLQKTYEQKVGKEVKRCRGGKEGRRLKRVDDTTSTGERRVQTLKKKIK